MQLLPSFLVDDILSPIRLLCCVRTCKRAKCIPCAFNTRRIYIFVIVRLLLLLLLLSLFIVASPLTVAIGEHALQPFTLSRTTNTKNFILSFWLQLAAAAAEYTHTQIINTLHIYPYAIWMTMKSIGVSFIKCDVDRSWNNRVSFVPCYWRWAHNLADLLRNR